MIVVTNNQPKEPTPAAPNTGEAEVLPTETPAAAETPAETLDASGTSTEDGKSPSTNAEVETKEVQAAQGKKNKGVQSRFDELTKQREDAKRELEYWKQAALKGKAPEPVPIPAKQPAPVAAAGEPDPNQFDSHATYLKALTKWTVDEERKASNAKVESEKALVREREIVEKAKSSIISFKETHPDFDQVVSDEFKLTQELANALRESDDAGSLMYNLCKNKEEFDRIVALPEAQMIRALGRFEAKLEPRAAAAEAAAPTITTSKAPPPINPVGNKGSGAGKKSLTDPNLSQKEFEALVMEQAKARGASW